MVCELANKANKRVRDPIPFSFCTTRGYASHRSAVIACAGCNAADPLRSHRQHHF
jgi:hypothetical protein